MSPGHGHRYNPRFPERYRRQQSFNVGWTELDKFWRDGADWVLLASYYSQARITVDLGSTPTPSQLIALRRALPEYRNTPPAQVKALLAANGGKLNLGVLGGIEAWAVYERLSANHISASLEDESGTHYLPFDRTSQTAMLIEDWGSPDEIIQEMINDGVTIIPSESD